LSTSLLRSPPRLPVARAWRVPPNRGRPLWTVPDRCLRRRPWARHWIGRVPATSCPQRALREAPVPRPTRLSTKCIA
ncbi:hypothetical protein AK812_SmicGene45983, partial [Symbiodinium microadriaticum]